MKNKITYLLLSVFILSIMILSGCGKKNNSISNNLINENPELITGDIPTITNNTEVDASSQFLTGTDSVSSQSVNGISGNSISGNASEAVIPTISPSSVSSSSIDQILSETLSNNISFGNISGKNIEKLYITFNVGTLVNTEVLGLDQLNDGNDFTYAITDMDVIKNTDRLTLSVTATTTDGDTINFGELDIIDASDINVLLAHNGKNGYYMYIE